MFFELLKNFSACHHDIWIFCWLYYSLLKLSVFIKRHLTKEFSFAPSYFSILSTRSRKSIPNYVDFAMLSLFSHHALFRNFVCYFVFCSLWFSSYFTLMLRRIMIFGFLFNGCIALTIFEISPTVGFIRPRLTREFFFCAIVLF